MKTLIIAATAVTLLAAPAFAGGNHGGSSTNSTGLGLSVVTGKGGVLGTVLGGKGSSQGVVIGTSLTTTKGGILGTVLGTSRRGY